MDESRNIYSRGSLSTADLLVLTSLDKLIFVTQYYLLFYEASYFRTSIVLSLSLRLGFPG
jgi:hypothetical protein